MCLGGDRKSEPPAVGVTASQGSSELIPELYLKSVYSSAGDWPRLHQQGGNYSEQKELNFFPMFDLKNYF